MTSMGPDESAQPAPEPPTGAEPPTVYPGQSVPYPTQSPYPAQPPYPTAEPTYPAYPTAQPGFPPAQPGFPPAQPGFSPAQPGFPPAQASEPATPAGYPPVQPGYPPAQPGYPPAQPGYPPAQPGYPYGNQPTSAVPVSGYVYGGPPGSAPPYAYGMPVPPPKKGPKALIITIVVFVAVVVLAGAGGLVYLVASQGSKPTSASSPTPGVTTEAPDPLAAPQVGTCYSTGLDLAGLYEVLNGDEVVPCTQNHTLETFEVGTFASTASFPTDKDEAVVRAYASCTRSSETFLGGDWRMAFTWLVVSVPNEDRWDDGARWYRCDLAPASNVFGDVTTINVSLKDGLRGAKPAAITCLNWSGKEPRNMTKIDCTMPHSGEYAGFYDIHIKGKWTDDAAEKASDDKCDALVRNFTGTGSGTRNRAFTYWFWVPQGPDPELGERFPCVITAANDKKLVGSVRNIKSKTPKYA